MRVFALSALVLAGFSCATASGDESKLAALGIAAEKPAEGPSVKVEDGFMVPYTLKVPGSNVEIEMVPVPGGTFMFGGSEDSDSFQEDQGPQIEVKVEPMWVAKYETTWQQYRLYMAMDSLFKDLNSRGVQVVDSSNMVDAVTAPTKLYDPSFTFNFGQEDRLPAVTMTQFAGKQYSKWLSKLTGHQYRIPSEAEWEYACRAGSESAYCFGDDDSELEDYAWYYDNADELPHEVGKKKPNAFGLYDTHGNVMEWVIDGYTEDGYASLADKPTPVSFLDAIRWAESYDNRVVRGGSFQDDPEQLTSAAKIASEDDDWKEADPNVPLSAWWYTTDPARGVGFRIFRSYKPLAKDVIVKFWDIDNEDIELDVEMRISDGRAAYGVVTEELASEIEKLDDNK